MSTQFWKDIYELHRLVEALPKPKGEVFRLSTYTDSDGLTWYTTKATSTFSLSSTSDTTTGYWEVTE